MHTLVDNTVASFINFYQIIPCSKLCDPLKLGIKWKNAEWNENGTRIEGRWVWPQHIKSRC